MENTFADNDGIEFGGVNRLDEPITGINLAQKVVGRMTAHDNSLGRNSLMLGKQSGNVATLQNLTATWD